MQLLSKLKRKAKHLMMENTTNSQNSFEAMTNILERSMILQSSSITSCQKSKPDSSKTLEDFEYKVFSQFGDDGIISYLTSFVQKEQRTFIEFGAEDYTEANTRLLLERDNWSGLIIDGSAENIVRLKSRHDLWRYDLTAIDAFITRDNINSIISANHFDGQIGLLSIDIDGNDYWIWDAISVVKPLIVVCEYNSIFGPDAPISVPYDPQFVRSSKHFSHLYAGASLRALDHLARQRNLQFVGCNRAGNNAYFVHGSLNHGIPLPSIADGFVASRFLEARDANGDLMLKTSHKCMNLIEDLPVVDVINGTTLSIKESLVANYS